MSLQTFVFVTVQFIVSAKHDHNVDSQKDTIVHNTRKYYCSYQEFEGFVDNVREQIIQASSL